MHGPGWSCCWVRFQDRVNGAVQSIRLISNSLPFCDPTFPSFMLIISHPTGNQNVRNAALAFYRANALARFFTTVAWSAQSPLNNFFPRRIINTLQRREYAMLPSEKLGTRPLRESCRLLANALHLNGLTRNEKSLCGIDSVYRDLDAYVARQLTAMNTLTDVYTYDHCALKTLEKAKRIGVRTNLELSWGYWREGLRIFREETELNPHWAVTMPALEYSHAHYCRKDEEITLADRIIVASSYAASHLSSGNFKAKEIIVIPYGSPPPVQLTNPGVRPGKKLRALYVGGLTQRKGISYLFGACRLLGDRISLTVIGGREKACPALDRELARCRYIPSLPHAEVLREMREHDVLVFPSLWDAFGLVILEALSQGIPVITTPNTAGPDIITNASDGFIVPIRSEEAIAEKLEALANDADLLALMKNTALTTAARFSWSRYHSALTKNVLTPSGAPR